MHTIWMGVRPGLEVTRILVQDAGVPRLKARLPEAPAHPRALETLAEGVALWCGRPLYVALGVAAEDALCVSLRVSVHRDHSDRRIVITQISRS